MSAEIFDHVALLRLVSVSLRQLRYAALRSETAQADVNLRMSSVLILHQMRLSYESIGRRLASPSLSIHPEGTHLRADTPF